MARILETGAAALLFAAVFLVRARRNPLRALMRDTRDIVSFGAGLSAAYVAGAVIMNSAIIELPAGEDVRARPFLLGGVVYGVLLLLLH